jgi:hypothetical protein
MFGICDTLRALNDSAVGLLYSLVRMLDHRIRALEAIWCGSHVT